MELDWCVRVVWGCMGGCLCLLVGGGFFLGGGVGFWGRFLEGVCLGVDGGWGAEDGLNLCVGCFF